jgi:flavodoxin
MKTLVVFYSRTGNTKRAAKDIAENIKSDVDEIIDKKSRKGIFGWLGGGRDAFKKKLTDIRYKKDPAEYDLVIIGTPVWAGTMAPAVRTYLIKQKIKKVAFFCTYGGNKGKSFIEMENLVSKPIAVLDIKAANVDTSQDRIRKFCDRLK